MNCVTFSDCVHKAGHAPRYMRINEIKQKIILLILLVITFNGCGPYVRNPRSDVSFTYRIGWWPYQENLEINNMEVKILDSRLNLFNSKSLIQIIITGYMKNRENWRPYVKKAHISENVIKRASIGAEGEIKITPIIKTKEDKFYKGELLPFCITQELIIHSMNWGENLLHIHCGNIKKTLSLSQMK
ncbi:MAG: hypothetical protein ACMUIU_01785 [bacterium]